MAFSVTFIDNRDTQYNDSADEIIGFADFAGRLWIGDRDSASFVQVKHRQITHVINCEKDIHGSSKEEGIVYLNIDPEADEACFDESYSFLVTELTKPDNNVLVHCLSGNGRSCSILLYFFMRYLGTSLAEAHRTLKRFRKTVQLRADLVRLLLRYELEMRHIAINTIELTPARKIVYKDKVHISWPQLTDEQKCELVSTHCGDSSLTCITLSSMHLFEESGSSTNVHQEVARKLLERFRICCVPCIVDLSAAQRSSAVVLLEPEPILDLDHADGSSAMLEPAVLSQVGALFTQAMGLYDSFDLSGACSAFVELLRVNARHKKARFNLASLCHTLELPSLAVHHTTWLLLMDPEDMTAHSLLWALAQASPEIAESCIASYRLLASRGDIKAAHKLATLTGEGGTAVRGDPDYARKIYDDLAGAFEGRLVDRLGYKGPWQLEEIVSSVVCADPNGFPRDGHWKVLDLGCGSGLVGKVFASYCHSNQDFLSAESHMSPSALEDLSCLLSVKSAAAFMAGVDVSIRMVEITRSNARYHGLACCDLQEALKALSGAALDMVIAADTFIYVGALGSTFAAVKRALRESRGLFAFTTEDLEASPMRLPLPATSSSVTPLGDDDIAGAVPGWGAALLSSARFAHSTQYIQQLAALHGLVLLRRQPVVLRTEGTVPLTGHLFLLST